MSDSIPEILQHIRDSIENSRYPDAGQSLRRLVKAEGARWRSLLLLNGFFPEPNSANQGCLTSPHLKELVGELQHGSDDRTIATNLIEVHSASVGLTSVFNELRDYIGTLECSTLAPENQIHRLMILLEQQAQLGKKKALELLGELGEVRGTLGQEAHIESPIDGSKNSLVEGVEGLCETVDLALRLILHTSSLPESPDLGRTPSPLNDESFLRYIHAAGVWLEAGFAWGNIKYRGWKWRNAAKERPAECFPCDPEEYVREHAAAARYLNYLTQLGMLAVVRSGGQEQQKAYLDRVALSTSLPAVGQLWDGTCDAEALKLAAAESEYGVWARLFVEERHYSAMLSNVRIENLCWEEWLSGTTLLRTLASVFEMLIAKNEDSLMTGVIAVQHETLVGVITRATDLGEEKAKELITAVRFDPKRKSLEIWDQPLIPCGKEVLLLTPSLITMGSAWRALENITSQWGTSSFGDRGTPFEHYICAQLQEQTTGKAVSGLSLTGTDGAVEFDVIFHWEGHVILLEAKCQKSVFSAADFHRAKQQTEKSIQQLQRRRTQLESCWEELGQRALELGLPPKYPGQNKVLCISVTNIMDFTGLVRDGIVVTDDVCLLRFFGEAGIKKFSIGQSHVEVSKAQGRIRPGKHPTPLELMKYLSSPPQMAAFSGSLKIGQKTIVTPGRKGFVTAHPELTPPV